MSLTRVQNFSIALDGFGTGDGLALDAPFEHAGSGCPTRHRVDLLSIAPWAD